jgi:hypothetical protein
MFPQIVYSQYGSARSYYGNIAYGLAPKLFQVYGAWPEERPAQPGMLVEDWQEPTGRENLQVVYEAEISARIEIIHRLKIQVEAETDLKIKNRIREQLRIEREAKERAFKLKAMIDEEESLFILLH